MHTIRYGKGWLYIASRSCEGRKGGVEGGYEEGVWRLEGGRMERREGGWFGWREKKGGCMKLVQQGHTALSVYVSMHANVWNPDLVNLAWEEPLTQGTWPPVYLLYKKSWFIIRYSAKCSRVYIFYKFYSFRLHSILATSLLKASVTLLIKTYDTEYLCQSGLNMVTLTWMISYST